MNRTDTVRSHDQGIQKLSKPRIDKRIRNKLIKYMVITITTHHTVLNNALIDVYQRTVHKS